jgi:hypothetical protein
VPFCLGGLDETVDTLDQSIGDPAVEPSQDAVPVALDGASGVNDRRKVAVCRPEVPPFEERCASLGQVMLTEFLACEAESGRRARS